MSKSTQTVVCATVPKPEYGELLRGGVLMVIRWFFAYPVVYLSYYVKGLQRAPWRVGADRGFDGVGIIVMNHRNAFYDVMISQIAGPKWSFFLIDPSAKKFPLWYLLCRFLRGVSVARKTGRDGRFRFRRGPVAFLKRQDWASERLNTLDDIKARQERNTAFLATQLVNRHWINIFPEGMPRVSSKLLPLRRGAARIALEAQARSGWTLPLKVFPLGLNYENQFISGSTVLAQWGRSIDVLKYRALYDEDKSAAEAALTTEIESQLKAVVIEADTEEQLALGYRLAAQRKDLTLGGVRRAIDDVAAGVAAPKNLRGIEVKGQESVVFQIGGYVVWGALAVLVWPFRMFGRWCAKDRSEEVGFSLLLWILCLLVGALVSEWRWVAQIALLTWIAARSWLWAWRRGVIE